MKKKKITPLGKEFLEAFDKTTNRITPKARQIDQVAVLQEQLRIITCKVRAARLGGVGNIQKLVNEERALHARLEEAKKQEGGETA